jgi:hypothetical protein
MEMDESTDRATPYMALTAPSLRPKSDCKTNAALIGYTPPLVFLKGCLRKDCCFLN